MSDYHEEDDTDEEQDTIHREQVTFEIVGMPPAPVYNDALIRLFTAMINNSTSLNNLTRRR